MIELTMMGKKEALPPAEPSQVLFDNSAETLWVVPPGVTSISAVAVGGGGAGGGGGKDKQTDTRTYGGGGGGGGGLAYAVSIPVTPGETLRVRAGIHGAASPGFVELPSLDGGDSGIWRGDVALLHATGGQGAFNRIRGTGGTRRVGSGGGAGGVGAHGSLDTGNYGGGAGGAGGYFGTGGQGAYHHKTYPVALGYGTGGSGSGGDDGEYGTGGKDGGGVGVIKGTNTTNYTPSGPGSGGTAKLYGGGGGGANTSTYGNNGGRGAVRIIWGEGRAYPSTNTEDVIA